MAKPPPKLEWCIVRLGNDLNWWVEEISDSIHWDTDGLSIIDPRQVAHILDLLDPLRDYGFQADLFESAFYPFGIKDSLPDGRVRLVRVRESLLESEDKLFALPDQIDEEKGPYADFLDHITKLRVKFLNDAIEFEQRLTVHDLEEEIREDHHNAFMEGRAIHAFQEITEILEYVPEGYELDEATETEPEEAAAKAPEEEIANEFPEVEEENIEEDETMKWDEDEEKKEEGEAGAAEQPTEDLDSLADDDDEEGSPKKKKSAGDDDDEDADEEDEDDDRPAKKSSPAKVATKTAPKPAKAPAKPAKKK
jgi:hypothetical protein